MPPQELGLSREELIALYNDAVEAQKPERQAEIKARAAEWSSLGLFDEGMNPDLAALVMFTFNAIRTNNKRLAEQLRSN